MKQIILTFALVLTGLALFGQSPRIRLNQITKDSITGSIVLSGSDSNMVYSRDFFVNFQDSILILFGDTLSTTATAFTGVTTDLTLTGNGTSGSELKVDTGVIATVRALSDSLAGIISSVTTDLTLTGDGSVATPLKVDTTVIATIKALSDSLATLSFATNQDISDSLATLSFATNQDISDSLQGFATLQDITDTLDLNARGFLTSEVDGSVTNEGSLTVLAGTGSTSIISSNTSGSTDVTLQAGSNITLTESGNTITIASSGGGGGGGGTVDTDLTLTGDGSGGDPLKVDTTIISTIAGLNDSLATKLNTSFSNVTGTLPVANGGTGATTLTSGAFLKGNGTSAVSGSSNLTETADTVFVSKYLNVDTATLFVNADSNRVGIGTSSPNKNLHVVGALRVSNSSPIYSEFPESDLLILTGGSTGRYGISIGNHLEGGSTKAFFHYQRDSSYTIFGTGAQPGGSNPVFLLNSYVTGTEYDFMRVLADGEIQFKVTGVSKIKIEPDGDVVIPNAYTKTTGSGGDLWVDTDGTLYRNSSSIRYKQNIKDYDKGINKLMELKPVYYEKINNNRDVVYAGFIAEQVDEIGLNEFVLYDTDGRADAIHYESITALLTKAIQEQQAIIETQKQEIDTLKAQYETLLQRIINLENK